MKQWYQLYVLLLIFSWPCKLHVISYWAQLVTQHLKSVLEQLHHMVVYQCWKLGQFAMPDTFENWLGLVNSWFYRVHHTREIYQALPNLVDFKAPMGLWNPLSKTILSTCNKEHVMFLNYHKAQKLAHVDIFLIFTLAYDNPMHTLKTESCHNANFVVTVCTEACHNNIRWKQWRQSWHHVNIDWPEQKVGV